MDRIIKRFDVVKDNDLMLCERHGVAYQRNMGAGRVDYGDKYLATYDSFAYEGSDTARAVIDGRCALVARHASADASLLDIGAASGAFVRAAIADGLDAKGYDIIEKAAQRLKSAGLYADDPNSFDSVTLWDTIEHMEEPETCLKHIKRDALVFVSIPVFDDLKKIRESKHYKPGEHLYYWTITGFIDWMAIYGFRLLEMSTHEIEAGRESVGAFAFKRDLPDCRDYIAAYMEMHAMRHYGSSATELHLNTVAGVVKQYAPQSILDYGCGRSDLVAHFWLDGKRELARYDPAIPAYKRMPHRNFNLVLCCDVLEHIPMASIDRVLKEIIEKSPLALFTISTKLARAKLPDGRNAHVTLLSKSEWFNWLKNIFGNAVMLPSELEFELVVLAGAKK